MKETYGYQKRPICTMIIAGMNIAVFFVLSFRGMTEDAGFLLENGASYAPYILERGEYYRLFTSMFLHFGFEHLMNNMLMLLVIGWNLERELGKIRFLLIYLCSGLCGNVLSLWLDVHTGSYAVAAGASGAVFGIIGALLYVAIRNHGRVGNVTGRGLLFMAVMSLYYGFTSEGVDNFAHIGGLLSGFLLAVLLYWKTKRKRSGDVWNG